MTSTLATVCAVTALLIAPAPVASASVPLDLGDLPIVGPIVDGLLGEDPAPTTPPAPTPDPTVPALPSNPPSTGTGGSGNSGGGGASSGGSGQAPGTGVPGQSPESGSAPASGTVNGGTPTATTDGAPTDGTGAATTSAPPRLRPGSGPLLQPDEGTTLVFTPDAQRSAEITASGAPARTPDVDGRLLVVVLMGSIVGGALVLSRVWGRRRRTADDGQPTEATSSASVPR